MIDLNVQEKKKKKKKKVYSGFSFELIEPYIRYGFSFLKKEKFL